ncbi:hypothetical protein ACHAXA_007290, partial [Cyclostephanos tholiformis]
MDDFYERALSSLTRRIVPSNDDGGDGARSDNSTAATAGLVVFPAPAIPIIDDVLGALESHAISLVEDDVPKIDRAVRNYLALVAARSSVASDVDVLSASRVTTTITPTTTTTTTFLTAPEDASDGGLTSSRAARNAASDVNLRSLLCARALLLAINSTIIPLTPDDDDDDDGESEATTRVQSSREGAATRILWNRLVIQSSSKFTSDSPSGRINKPSNSLGRRSLIVAYPYIRERLRRGHDRGRRTDVDADVDGGIESGAMSSTSLSGGATTVGSTPRSARRQAVVRALSDDVLPPAIPPIGIDHDQWESFYAEFGRLLFRDGDDDDDDDDDGVREGHVRRGERRPTDQGRRLMFEEGGSGATSVGQLSK